MKYDDILKVLGEFGPYQKRIYFLLCLPAICCAMHKLVWVFLGAIPNYRCSILVDEAFNNTLSYNLPDSILNFSIPRLGNNKIDQCKYYILNETFMNPYPTDFDSLNYTWISILQNITTDKSEKCSSWVYDKSVYPNSVVTEFNLVCDANWQRALVQSLFMAGEFVGALVAGTISDKFGRRRVFFFSCISQAVFGILSGAVSNYYLYLIFRGLVGLFNPGVFIVGFVIGLELVGPKKRLLAGVGSQFFFATGYMLSALVAYFIRDWHYLQIAISLPGLFFLAYWWFIPESARWLLAKNRVEDAKELLNKIAKENGTKLPDNFDDHDLHSTTKEFDNPLLLFKYPNLRKKSLIIFFNWFVNSGVYYGLAFNTSNLGGNDYINFLIAAGLEYPAYIFCFFALDKIGRRIPLSGWLFVGAISLIGTCFLEEGSVALIVLAMTGKLAITISYAVIYIFSAELYPTVVRNLGMGMSSTCARLGGILAPFIILLADISKPLPLLIFGIEALLAGILALFLPETKGADLPDTLQDGESFGKKISENVVRESDANNSKQQQDDLNDKETGNKHANMSIPLVFGEITT